MCVGTNALVSNFDGSREELIKRLGEIDVMTVYNATRKQGSTACMPTARSAP